MSSLKDLEDKEKRLFARFYNLPNGELRAKRYKRWKKIYDRITARTNKSKV